MGKQLTVIAGPNGSGKTTLAQEYLSQHEALYFAADAIAEELSPGTPELAKWLAGRRFLIALKDALHRDRSLVVESTLSGRKLFAASLDLARECGFTTTIVFLFLDSADTCVARVQQRRRKGGHGVPEADIRRRFDRSLRNFWTAYRFLADDWAVMYNAGSEFQDVAFGAADSISIRNEALFKQFIDLAGRIEV